MRHFKARAFALAILCLILFSHLSLRADEGMWLISLIHKNMEAMQKMGLTLTAEDIYSINSSSLKDAVVQLDDGGCSAELISPFGLVLTNHHCAVSDIKHHSSPIKNLLEDGFWANSFDEELYVPGKTALILKRVEDVTQKVLSEVEALGDDFFSALPIALDRIGKQYELMEKGTHVKVVPMFNNNQFFLFVYYRFTDVRLVGAPPSSIGNFGGDVDNWRWPRHTGDFALFRIYASPDGMPSDYSKKNKPYKPAHYFPVSLEGINEGDFTMVLGFPGTTHRFSTSHHAKHERDVVAPWVKNVWGDFIETIKDGMQDDVAVKVHYTDTHDGLVNFYQKDTYQAQAMHRFNVVERLKNRENELIALANTDPEKYNHYFEALEAIELYHSFVGENGFEELFRSLNAIAGWPVELSEKVYEIHPIFIELIKDKPSRWRIRRESRKLRKRLPGIYDSYFPEVDMKLYSAALNSILKYLPEGYNDGLFNELKQQQYPEFFIPIIVSHFYERSYFTSKQNMLRFLKKPSLDSLAYDPIFMLQLSYETLIESVQDSIAPYRLSLRQAMRDFTQGILELYPDKLHYPDANSTLRLSYGKVAGYKPRDGVSFRHITYLDGKMEKEDYEVDVFNVPSRIKELWHNKDFGPYADEKGVPICFITDNDITNGNSGSPVLNAKGHLIGVAFDGNYEAMACDFIFEPHMQRTIVTDIRYVLFVIDKFAGAKRLIDEMKIINPN